MKTLPRRQSGIALLIALLTVALAAVLIAGLLDRGELALARTRNVLRSEQADAYAQALEAYAAQVLLKDLDDDRDEDSNTDIWAAPLPPQQVPGGMIVASMRDLNGCFNLNNLAAAIDTDANWMKMFTRLLNVRGVDPNLGTAIKDWIGSGSTSGADGVDAPYLAQPVPYRSAQRLFVHVSELRLVRGVTSESYAALAPYVCALPPPTKINVNTASVPVLQTLGDRITTAQAESLWQNGQAHWTVPYLKDWANIPYDANDMQYRVATASDHFLARGDVTLDGIPFTFYSLIERLPQYGIRVVERSRGSDDALVAPALPDANRDGGH